MERKISLVRGKGIFITDILLTISFFLVVWSGLALHMTTHQKYSFGWAHGVWTYIHIVWGLAFIILIFLHVKSHLNWYKGLLKRGLKNRSKITIIISLLFLLSIITGVISIFINSSSMGLTHYKLSLIILPFALIHIIARIPMIVKAFK